MWGVAGLPEAAALLPEAISVSAVIAEALEIVVEPDLSRDVDIDAVRAWRSVVVSKGKLDAAGCRRIGRAAGVDWDELLGTWGSAAAYGWLVYIAAGCGAHIERALRPIAEGAGGLTLRKRLGYVSDVAFKNQELFARDWYRWVGLETLLGYTGGSYPGSVSRFLEAEGRDWVEWEDVKGGMVGGAYYARFSDACDQFFQLVCGPVVRPLRLREWIESIDPWAGQGASKLAKARYRDHAGSHTGEGTKAAVAAAYSTPALLREAYRAGAGKAVLFIKPNEAGGKFRAVASVEDRLQLLMGWLDHGLQLSVRARRAAEPGAVFPTSMFDSPPEFLAGQWAMGHARGVSLPVDQSKFDRHVTLQEQLLAVSALEKALKKQGWVDPEVARAFERVRCIMRDMHVQAGDVVLEVRNGLLSGLRWTSLFNAVVNYSQSMVADSVVADETGRSGRVMIRVQGDDGDHKFTDAAHALAYYLVLSQLGVVVNPKKFCFNDGVSFYLRKLYKLGLAVGPPARAVRAVAYGAPDRSDVVGAGAAQLESWLLLARRLGACCAWEEGMLRSAQLPRVAYLDCALTLSRMIGGEVAFDDAVSWAHSPRYVDVPGGGGLWNGREGEWVSVTPRAFSTEAHAVLAPGSVAAEAIRWYRGTGTSAQTDAVARALVGEWDSRLIPRSAYAGASGRLTRWRTVVPPPRWAAVAAAAWDESAHTPLRRAKAAFAAQSKVEVAALLHAVPRGIAQYLAPRLSSDPRVLAGSMGVLTTRLFLRVASGEIGAPSVLSDSVDAYMLSAVANAAWGHAALSAHSMRTLARAELESLGSVVLAVSLLVAEWHIGPGSRVLLFIG